jgi:hypothetical protein
LREIGRESLVRFGFVDYLNMVVKEGYKAYKGFNSLLGGE